VPRAGAYIGIAASLAFTAYATLTVDGGKLWNLGRFNFPLHNYMIGVIGHIVLVGTGWAAAVALPDRDAGRRRLTYWGFRGSEATERKVSAASQPLPSK